MGLTPNFAGHIGYVFGDVFHDIMEGNTSYHGPTDGQTDKASLRLIRLIRE